MLLLERRNQSRTRTPSDLAATEAPFASPSMIFLCRNFTKKYSFHFDEQCSGYGFVSSKTINVSLSLYFGNVSRHSCFSSCWTPFVISFLFRFPKTFILTRQTSTHDACIALCPSLRSIITRRHSSRSGQALPRMWAGPTGKWHAPDHNYPRFTWTCSKQTETIR